MSRWRPGPGWSEGVAGLDWAPSGSRDALRLRAWVNRLVREFFFARDVLEVETPMMSRAGNTDPNIASFALEFSGRTDGASRTRWLRTSPEFPLKRLLAAGVGDCFELGRVFRDGEAGGRHNPEFTMLEWYRVGWTLEPLMDETVALVQAALSMVGRSATVARVSFRDLYRQQLGVDPMTADLETVRNAAAGIAIDGDGLTRDDWLDLLMTHRLQPTFGHDQIRVVHDYPASQCALAKVVERDGMPVAERFELYLGPLELANGYHELTDAGEQARRFEADLARRRAEGLPEVPMDGRLVAALRAGLPPCAGVACGLDRMLLAARGGARIDEVLAFPLERA